MSLPPILGNIYLILCHIFFMSHTEIREPNFSKGEDEHEADLQHSPKKAIISLLFEEYNQNGARSRLNWSSAFSRNLNH